MCSSLNLRRRTRGRHSSLTRTEYDLPPDAPSIVALEEIDWYERPVPDLSAEALATTTTGSLRHRQAVNGLSPARIFPLALPPSALAP